MPKPSPLDTTLLDPEKQPFVCADSNPSTPLSALISPQSLKSLPWSVSKSWPLLRRGLHFLVPSFVNSQPRTSDTRRLHPTAWLDGMRGLAAFLVCIDHLSYSNHNVYTAWGSTEQGNREFLKLPLIRFFYTGAFMVAIFFVISGYALSYKPVKLMRKASWPELQQTLASSVFRRAIRLYLPCVASTFCIIVLVRLGVYEWTKDIANDPKRFNIRREGHPHRYDTLWEQLAVWIQKMIYFVDPWTFDMKEGDAALNIDGHLWTIPVEFRASLVLYLTQLGFSRLRPTFRLLGLLGLMLWAHQKDRWEMLVFFAGFVLAELDIARREEHDSASTSTSPSATPTHNGITPSRTRKIWNAVYITSFIVGVYFGGQPGTRLDTAPGWRTLASLIPSQVRNKQRYWTGWGAMLVIWSTSNHIPLQRIFTNRFVQYLGQISYPMYLVHGAVIHTVGYATMDVLWRAWGRETWLGKEGGFAIAGVLSVSITIWAADVFMRLVDTPTVRFAKWLEGRLSRR